MITDIQSLIMLWIGMVFMFLVLVAIGVVIVLTTKFLFRFFNTKTHMR